MVFPFGAVIFSKPNHQNSTFLGWISSPLLVFQGDLWDLFEFQPLSWWVGPSEEVLIGGSVLMGQNRPKRWLFRGWYLFLAILEGFWMFTIIFSGVLTSFDPLPLFSLGITQLFLGASPFREISEVSSHDQLPRRRRGFEVYHGKTISLSWAKPCFFFVCVCLCWSIFRWADVTQIQEVDFKGQLGSSSIQLFSHKHPRILES